jgi:hypothetical protein
MNLKCYKSVILEPPFLLMLIEQLKNIATSDVNCRMPQYLCQASLLSEHYLIDEFLHLL